jgi:hypothetical protein
MDWLIHYFYIGVIIFAWNRQIYKAAMEKGEPCLYCSIITAFIMIIIWPAVLICLAWEDE